jgi:glutamine cyclotransferase
MDTDVEMTKRDRDEVGPAVELIEASPLHSRLLQQNRCFAVSLVVSLLVLLYFTSTQYQAQVDRPLEAPSDQAVEDGDIKVNLDASAVADGANRVKKHSHHGYSLNATTGKGATDATASDTKIQEWLDAVVSLGDGVKFEVVQQLKHDKSSFTEGLAFVDGVLYESVGMYQQSALLVLNATSGETLERYDMSGIYFAEGLTHVDGKLIQLTYKRSTGFIYDIKDLSTKPKTFEFHSTTGEGWGLTYDPVHHELIMSDGSEFLHFWDPDTMLQKRKVAVSLLDGSLANNINELEYWRGRIIANVWYRDILLVIHPETGKTEKEYGETKPVCPNAKLNLFDLNQEFFVLFRRYD